MERLRMSPKKNYEKIYGNNLISYKYSNTYNKYVIFIKPNIAVIISIFITSGLGYLLRNLL